MKKLSLISVPTAMLAVVLALGGGAAMAKGGGGGGGGSSGGGGTTSGTWPAAFPLPTNPGTVTAQSSTRATVRSTDTVTVVQSKLDDLYVNQKGCTLHVAVNRPKDYFCAEGEVYFTFAALDPTPTDPSRSQSNAFRG